MTKAEAPPVSGDPLPVFQSASVGDNPSTSSSAGLGEWKSRLIFDEPLLVGGVWFIFLVPAEEIQIEKRRKAMKIEKRWMRYFFGLNPALAFVVVPTFALVMCVLIFTDKASIKRLKSHASDYGQRIRKMERQMPDFAMKDSMKPISFAYSKSALRRNAEFVSIMQWGMREAAEQQMAKVRERIKNRRRPGITHVETTLSEEEWKRRETMRQLEEAARQ